MTREAFHCLPKTAAGAKMPSHASITLADHNERKAAEIGSERLRDAVRKLAGLRPWK
jgi:hypothetical protein